MFSWIFKSGKQEITSTCQESMDIEEPIITLEETPYFITDHDKRKNIEEKLPSKMYVVATNGIPSQICLSEKDANLIVSALKDKYLAQPNMYHLQNGKTLYIYQSGKPCHKLISKITIHICDLFQQEVALT